ncbi:MAG: hypothetical protein GF311_06475 [Candidatus Lokiarchaeota archaeon]|nr:hypothetical protein [Candidatus Lokiarchaeota archaeon]
MSKESSENLVLKWNESEGTYDPITSDGEMDDGIFLEFLPENNHWKYFYIRGTSLIARRTALRAANSIAKTGYLHPKTQIRYGSNLELKEENSPYEDMPEQIKRAQRTWYDPSYKQNKVKKEE